MRQLTWFDRTFDFSFGIEKFPLLMERLRRAPIRYRQAVTSLSESALQAATENTWSIKTHIGHLSVLEPLWQQRFRDIANGASVMSPADLTNKATEDAGFDSVSLQELLANFETERNKTLAALSLLRPESFTKRSLHPRLKRPMRVVDLTYFIAEHDDHHRNSIARLILTAAVHPIK